MKVFLNRNVFNIEKTFSFFSSMYIKQHGSMEESDRMAWLDAGKL